MKMRKLLSMALVACLMICLLTCLVCVDAFAADYDLYVGGVQVTDENKNAIIIDGDNTLASYDPDTKTLTLNGEISGVYSNGGKTYGIYTTLSQLKIVSEALSKITASNADYGIYSTGSVEIRGRSLSVGSGSAMPRVAVYCQELTSYVTSGEALTVYGADYGIECDAFIVKENTTVNSNDIAVKASNMDIRSEAMLIAQPVWTNALTGDGTGYLCCPLNGLKDLNGNNLSLNGYNGFQKDSALAARNFYGTYTLTGDMEITSSINFIGAAKFVPNGHTIAVSTGVKLYVDGAEHTHAAGSPASYSYAIKDAENHLKNTGCAGCPIGYVMSSTQESHSYDTDGKCLCGAEAGARIGSTYYADLTAAAAEATGGNTIIVLKDTTVGSLTLASNVLVQTVPDVALTLSTGHPFTFSVTDGSDADGITTYGTNLSIWENLAKDPASPVITLLAAANDADLRLTFSDSKEYILDLGGFTHVLQTVWCQGNLNKLTIRNGKLNGTPGTSAGTVRITAGTVEISQNAEVGVAEKDKQRVGVYMEDGTLYNKGIITGGDTVSGSIDGGAGVKNPGGKLYNSGTITGGSSTGTSWGGPGVYGSVTENAGTITGGSSASSRGGQGVYGFVESNAGEIAGGNGVTGGWGVQSQVNMPSTTYVVDSNTGTITGGSPQNGTAGLAIYDSRTNTNNKPLYGMSIRTNSGTVSPIGIHNLTVTLTDGTDTCGQGESLHIKPSPWSYSPKFYFAQTEFDIEPILTYSGNDGALTEAPMTIGSYTLTVTGSGDYSNTGSLEMPFTLLGMEQAALVITEPDRTVYGDSLALATTGGSGNGEVSFRVLSGNGVIDAYGQLLVTGLGEITVQATKAGDGTYASASAQTTLTVSPRPLIVSSVTVESRPYNGRKTVALSSVALSNIVNTDDVSVVLDNATAELPDANAGSYSQVTLTALTLTGTDKDKYVLDTKDKQAVTSVTISKLRPTGEPVYTSITESGKTLEDAKLTVEGSSFSTPGSVDWQMPRTTEAKADTGYTWVFTPTDMVNYEIITGELIPYISQPGDSGGGTGQTTPPTGDNASVGIWFAVMLFAILGLASTGYILGRKVKK